LEFLGISDCKEIVGLRVSNQATRPTDHALVTESREERTYVSKLAFDET